MIVAGVLLDAAGTLIVPREPVGETYARAARRRGVNLPGWRLDDAFRRVLARAAPMVFPGADGDTVRERERESWRAIVRSTFLAADSTVRFPDPDALFEELFAHFARGTAWRVVAGAPAALAALRRRGHRLGIASNFDHRLHSILQDLDLKEFFDSVTLPGTCGLRKPDPAFFAAAVAALGTAPGETLHVGNDPERDAAAARAAGLHALLLSEVDGGWAGLPARVAALATLDRLPGVRTPGGGEGHP